jgi:hypothetical protein
MNIAELALPFPAKDVEWRIQKKSKDGRKALVIAYHDARTVMYRLDEAVGPENWQDSYRPGADGGVICSLRVRFGDEWIAKEDGAENTQVEAIKGGISDAFKRAGVKWGIGRYLYDVPAVWVPLKSEYGDFDPPKLPPWALPKGDTSSPRAEKVDTETGEITLPPFPEEAPAAPKPDVPEWVEKFNTDRKRMGIGNSLIEEVIGTKLSITNIEKWLAAEDGRTPDKLLSLAADRGAVGVR